MTIPNREGKFFFTLTLSFIVLIISSPSHKSGNFVRSSTAFHVDNEQHDDLFLPVPVPNNSHDLQLLKLQQLVKNLTDIVDRLESRLLAVATLGAVDVSSHIDELVSVSKSSHREKDQSDCDSKPKRNEEIRSVKEIKERDDNGGDEKSAIINGGGREKGPAPLSVMKYSPVWSERFQFVSAVKLDSDVTCTNVLPFKDHEGLSKYFAVGDGRGRVYVFSRNGDVPVEFNTLSDSPITAMLSYTSVFKNESFVVTGHKNGVILMHRVWEASIGEEWLSLSMEKVSAFEVPESGEEGDGLLSISILEVHHVGRMKYVLSADVSGKIRVYRENGSLYGIVAPTSKPLVFLKQRLLFLTEIGAGSLDLRTMKVRESECEGLNHSLARNYVFDTAERSKAYGFTSDSDLIQVLLLGDIMNFKCRVRSKRKFEMDHPVAFQAIRGYLLVVNQKKVFVYNVSSHHYVRLGVPRLLFDAGYDEIRSSFLNYQVSDIDEQSRTVIPLIASDSEKLVVLGLGDGYVGMYRSNLPIYKGESSGMFWTSPVLVFLIFLLGAWYFFSKKKGVLTSWGPDDPFTSASITTGAPPGSDSTRDRSFTDSSRTSDMMDLRGPSRRYPSPTEYPSGAAAAANSYRPATIDHNIRPATVEANFRIAPELKYRGTNIESTAFPKRRDGLFANSQVVNE